MPFHAVTLAGAAHRKCIVGSRRVEVAGFVRNACAKTVWIRQVPAITLRTVLGEWILGWRVARLKIDAQGSDLSVLEAAERLCCAGWMRSPWKLSTTPVMVSMRTSR